MATGIGGQLPDHEFSRTLLNGETVHIILLPPTDEYAYPSSSKPIFAEKPFRV